MINLLTAKFHLRIDTDDYDDEVLAKLGMADAIVTTYLAQHEVPPPIRLSDYVSDAAHDVLAEVLSVGEAARDAAVLLVLGELWANREAGAAPLGPNVTALLHVIKGPTWA